MKPPPHRIVMPGEPRNLGRLVIAAGCVYELVALWSRLPTITTIVKNAHRHPYLRVLAWVWGGVWAAHFFEA